MILQNRRNFIASRVVGFSSLLVHNSCLVSADVKETASLREARPIRAVHP